MKNTMNQLGLLAAVVALCGLWSCSSSTSPYGSNSAGNTTSTPNTVVMASMSFGPLSLTVAKGTTVTWRNDDGVAHTATSDSGDWDTGNIPPGGSKSVTFSTAGSFNYHCTVHPMMTGKIVVQ